MSERRSGAMEAVVKARYRQSALDLACFFMGVFSGDPLYGSYEPMTPADLDRHDRARIYGRDEEASILESGTDISDEMVVMRNMEFEERIMNGSSN